MRPNAATLALVCSTLIGIGAHADTTIFSTGFEAPTYTAGQSINGQDSWDAANGNAASSIETTMVKTGSQALEINTALATTPNSDTGAVRPINFNSTTGTDKFAHGSVDFYLSDSNNPSFWIPLQLESGPSPGAQVNGLRINVDQNQQILLSVDNTSTGTGVIITRNTWHHYDLYVDFNASRFWAYYDGVLLLPSGSPFVSFPNTDTNLSNVALFNGGQGTDTGFFDNLSIESVTTAPLVLTKSFSTPTVALNGGASLTFTVTNPNPTTALEGFFTDTIPSGLSYTFDGAQGNNNCTAIATAGSTSTTLNVGLGAKAGQDGVCAITIPITGIAAGIQNNTTAAVTYNGVIPNPGLTSNTATITVVGPPAIAKSFGAASVPLGSTTAVIFTLANNNAATTLTGLSFTDTLPAQFVVASTPGVVGNCNGTVTATAGSGTISLTGGSLGAGANCTIAVNVAALVAGASITNSVTANSTNGGQSNTASAVIAVVAPPAISKSFGASAIAVGGSTSLSLTITNPNAATVLMGVAVTDTFPAGLTISTPNGLTGSCGGGTITATAGSSTVSLTGATLAASAGCTFSVSVTGTTAGGKINTTGAVTSANGGTGNVATATTNVAGAPLITKSFGASTIPVGGSTSLSFTITNPNAGAALAGVAFTDGLPAGLTVSTPNGLTGSCGGGTIAATSGSSTVSLTGGTLAAGASCAFSVNVTATTAGVKDNTTGPVSSTNGGTGNTASASVIVNTPPSIIKSFGSPEIALNGTTTLTFSIANPNAGTSLTGLAFTDALPAGMVVATPSNLANTCGGTAAASGSTVSLSAGSIPASGSCTVTVSVQATSMGALLNSVTVSSANGGTGNTSTAILTVGTPPNLTKAFGATFLPVGGTTSLTFTLTNPNASLSLTGVGFTDSLPAGLNVNTPSNLNDTCGGTALASGSSITVSGVTLTGSETCTIVVTVKATAPGQQNNVTSQVSSNEGGNGAPATASILVADPPQITKNFNELTLPVGSTALVTFTITNPNTNVTLTGVNYTDTLPAGLLVATPNGLVNNCGGTATATANTIVLTGATLAPQSSCSVSANITATSEGPVTNSVTVASDQGTGNTATASIVLGPIFTVSYAANLNAGDSYVDFTNDGASVAAGTAQNICLNLYAFDPAEELISCCACSVTPNGLVSLSVLKSLTANPLTPAIPTAIVVKAIATSGAACDAASVSAANLTTGALAWGTTLHANSSKGFSLTEKPFSPAALSAAELTHITSTCGFIQSNGSGFGICAGCTAGGLGAAGSNQ